MPKITCGRRKEDKCKDVPDICEWNGTKCIILRPVKNVTLHFFFDYIS